LGYDSVKRGLMAPKDPKELMRLFDDGIKRIRNSDQMSMADRQKIADDLSEVYNYLSAVTNTPSLIKAMHARSAQDSKLMNQLAQERETLRAHQEFVENNFDKAEQYLKAIQLGGYATFFALWSIIGGQIHSMWSNIAALLMLTSATSFVVWEVCKSTILAFSIKRHASISAGRLEEFLRSRMSRLVQEKSAVIALAKSRAMVWLVCVIPAVTSIGIMVWQLITSISKALLL
jgi:hypothetical protein